MRFHGRSITGVQHTHYHGHRFGLTVTDSGQWLIDFEEESVDFDGGHGKSLCYATDNADDEIDHIPPRLETSGGRGLSFWKQDLDDTGELQLTLRGIGITSKPTRSNRIGYLGYDGLSVEELPWDKVIDKRVQFDVAVCAKQVQAWLEKRWLRSVSKPKLGEESLVYVELRGHLSDATIWAECDERLCGEACSIQKHDPTKKQDRLRNLDFYRCFRV
jgi:hypothetical protein